MVIDHQAQQLKRFHAALSAVVAPIQFAAALPIKIVDQIYVATTRQQALVEENASLRAEVLLLQGNLQRILALKNENNELRALLQSGSAVEQQVTVAQLLAVSSDPYIAQVVLDQGKKQRVYVGQPVLDAKGVMGQVIAVGPMTSRVMLITDGNSAVPVQIARTGFRGIVVGTGQRQELALINIADTSDIHIGDILTTSGLDMRYPEGYPVGTVTRVTHQRGEQFATITVKPTARLFQSRQVLLVWQKSKVVQEVQKQSMAMLANQRVT